MSWLFLLTTVYLAIVSRLVAGFDNSRYDNVASYWGQNSYGARHSDVGNFQKTLSFYCQDNSIDVIPLAFVNTFFGPGGAPVLNLANICNPTDNATFPGTNLADCSKLQSDIQFCQSKGKIITLSLGGEGGTVGFNDDSQGTAFANTIWNMFLGGSSNTRPFGAAVLDGVDLDIESGGSTGYAAFVNRIRSLASGASKKYYVTAAPQCVYPDSALQGVLNSANFDAIYVQFYNNPCGLTHANEANNWDYGLWDNWARHISPNPNVKVYVAAPADSTAAGSGYVDLTTLSNIAVKMRKSFPSFGGVALWDSSQAVANNNYQAGIKQALVAAGGTGFTFPPCSAPAWSAGTNYPGGSQVSFNGYIFQAKWFASSTPAADNANGDWMPMSACSGTPSGTTTSSPGPTGGSCSGVAAWDKTAVYVGGDKATFNGHLWTAKWWTQGETPGQADVWTDSGACTAQAAKAPPTSATDAAVKTDSPSSARLSQHASTASTAAKATPSSSPSVQANPEAQAPMKHAASQSTTSTKPTARSRFFKNLI